MTAEAHILITSLDQLDPDPVKASILLAAAIGQTVRVYRTDPTTAAVQNAEDCANGCDRTPAAHIGYEGDDGDPLPTCLNRSCLRRNFLEAWRQGPGVHLLIGHPRAPWRWTR